MAKTKDQLRLENEQNFPNNNTGFITAEKLRTFNDDIIDAIATTTDSASFDSRITDNSASIAELSSSFEPVSESIDSLNQASASFSTRVTDLEDFSSSLDTNFVSETEFTVFSGSVSSSLDNLQGQIDGLVISGSGIAVEENGVSQGAATTLNFTGSVSVTNVAGTATIEVTGGGGPTEGLVTTSSFNAYTSSNDARVQSLETETGSLQSQIDNLSGVTGSYATTSSLEAVSSSLSGRVTDLEDFSSSLDTTFVTEVELNASSSTLQNNIDEKLFTSSFNSFSSSIEGRVTTNETDISTLTSKTGSYATTASLEAVSSSLAGRVTTNTNNISTLTSKTGSYATTGSNTFIGTQDITGDVNVTGTLTATEIHTQYESASIIYSSGSTKFGDTQDDTHQFTGSVSITGSLSVTPNVPQSITASNSIYSQNTIVTGKNISGGLISKGTPLFFTGSGTAGNLVGLFPADAGNPERMPAGGIAGEDIIATEEGIVLLDGFINGVNTSLFDAGDKVYVAVGGGYTNVEPTGSAFIQFLGNIEKSAVNGSGVIQMMGESRKLPNLNSGSVWVGDGDSVPQSVLTSSLDVATAVSSSHSVNSDTSISASHAVQADNATTANSATTAISASHSVQSDNSTTAGTASTASYVQGGNVDGQVASALSSSYSITASYAENAAPTFPYTGDARINGSLGVTGSITRQESGFSGSVVDNIIDTFTSVPDINHIVTLTQTEYDGLVSVDPNTLYIISGSTVVDETFPYSGSAQITGSLGVTGSIQINDGTNSGDVITNVTDTYATPAITNVVTLTQAEYNAIVTPDDNTLYVISGSFVSGSGGTGDGFPYTGSADISGSLNVVGPITRADGTSTGSVIDNLYDDGGVPRVEHIVSITSASYAALGTKDPNTLYVVSGSTDAATLSPYTGSIRGNITTVTETTNTGSLDFSLGNFFTASIDDDTHFSVTNVQPGQTVIVRCTITNATPAVTFSPNVLQPSGSSYVPSANGSIDVLTFTSLDSTNALLVAVNKFE